MCEQCRRNFTDRFCSTCCFESGNAFIDDLPNSSDHPPQPQTQSFESNGDLTQVPFIPNPDPCYNQNVDINFPQISPSLLQYLCCTHFGGPHETFQCDHFIFDECIDEKLWGPHMTFTPYWKIPIIDDDDDEYTIQYREYLKNLSNAITPDLPTEEPDNSLSMGDEHLSTILEMELDEVINSSMEDLVLIPSESKGISDDTCDVPFCDNSPPLDVLNSHFEIFFDFNDDYTSSNDDSFENIDYVEASPPDSKLVSLEEVKDDILHEKLLNINLLIACDLPLSDDFSPISIFEEKYVTFSNPLFDSNDDFTSSDNESLFDEDVPKDVKIYSNPLFEFDDEYISSDVNPLFDEVLEDIECKDSYDSNLDESTFLVTPLSDSNEDECLAPCDDIELLLHHDPSIKTGIMIRREIYSILRACLDCLDFEGSRARCFVHRSLALQSLACLYWESDILNLID
ncbi:hypothetical protein Tco_0389093 [Tanacetum coccineum]